MISAGLRDFGDSFKVQYFYAKFLWLGDYAAVVGHAPNHSLVWALRHVIIEALGVARTSTKNYRSKIAKDSLRILIVRTIDSTEHDSTFFLGYVSATHL